METNGDLWTEFVQPIQRFFRRRISDKHTAEDLAQEVMLKVQSRLNLAPESDKLAGWIFQIARNTVIDFYRSPRSRGHLGLEEVDEPASGTDEAAVTSELAGCLRPMVKRLPQPYREAIHLTEFEGLSQQVLAERLGISISGAKSRVQRERRKLKEMLLACCHIEMTRHGQVVDYEPTERTAGYCGRQENSCVHRGDHSS